MPDSPVTPLTASEIKRLRSEAESERDHPDRRHATWQRLVLRLLATVEVGAVDGLRAAVNPERTVKQHEYTPGGVFELRIMETGYAADAGLPFPPHIVYIDRDEQDRRRTTFVADVHENAIAHARALATTPPSPVTSPDGLRERLAAIEHEQWMAWSQDLMSKELLTGDRIARWQSLWVPYADLSEEMKDHDREWADKVLAALENGEQGPDTAWLIERGQSWGQVPTMWYAGTMRWGVATAPQWTEDAWKAIRYASREEAEAEIDRRSGFPVPSHGKTPEHPDGHRFGVAVEHGFVTGPDTGAGE